jgi:intracellular multiplication protein IcmV
MGLISGVTNSLKSALSVDQLKSYTKNLKYMVGDILSGPRNSGASETFEEALERLQLTEADIERRKTQFQRLARIYLVLGLIVALYTIFLLFKKAFFPVLGCVGIMLIIISQYFRYSFWVFQIQQRRLGCTFREWLSEWTGKNR